MLKEKKAERLEQRRKERKQKRKIEAVEVKKAEEEKLGRCDINGVFSPLVLVSSPPPPKKKTHARGGDIGAISCPAIMIGLSIFVGYRGGAQYQESAECPQ